MLVAHAPTCALLRHGPLRDDAALPRGHRADHDRPAPVPVPREGGFRYGVRPAGE